MAVWLTLTGDSEKAVYATYDPITSMWSAESTLFVVSEVSSPHTLLSLAASDTEFALSWKVDVFESPVSNHYNYAKVYSGGAWSAAMRLNATTTPNLVTSPVVASNGTNFMFAWQEGSSIYSRSYSGSSLSASSTVYSVSTVFMQNIELVSNGSGYAVKLEHGTTPSSLDRFMAVVLNNGGAWTTSTTTEADVGFILRSNLASNGSGYLMTWVQDSITRFSLFDGSSWTVMSDLTDVDNTARRLTASGSDYLLSWTFAGDLKVKANSVGSWGSVITPELLTGTIGSYDVTATGTGYAFALQVNSASILDLYLLVYNGGATGTEVAVDSGGFNIYSPTIGFDGADTWLAWQQSDGVDVEMQLVSAAYTGGSLAAAETNLNKQNHGGGLNKGKVATTPLGIKVAAWGQNFFDETGTKLTKAYARVDNGFGWSAPVLLENFANLRDVVAVGEDIVVLLDVGGGWMPGSLTGACGYRPFSLLLPALFIT